MSLIGVLFMQRLIFNLNRLKIHVVLRYKYGLSIRNFQYIPLAIFLVTAPNKLTIFRCCPICMSIFSSDNNVNICSLSVQSETKMF